MLDNEPCCPTCSRPLWIHSWPRVTCPPEDLALTVPTGARITGSTWAPEPPGQWRKYIPDDWPEWDAAVKAWDQGKRSKVPQP